MPSICSSKQTELQPSIFARMASKTLASFALLLAVSTIIVASPIAKQQLVRRGNLPTPIAVSTAKSYLSALTVEDPSNDPAYERDYFKTWDTISGACDTREYVLKRDGTDVVTDSSCRATSGTWYSDYDGATWTDEGDLDIDHLVPLVSQTIYLHEDLLLMWL